MIRLAVLKLLDRRDKLLNKYHNCAPDDIENNFLFSNGRKPLHQGFLHAQAREPMRSLLMLLLDKPRHNEYSDRKIGAPSEFGPCCIRAMICGFIGITHESANGNF
jgi:hypothetical protein